jgi:serine/threonine protein kinase
VLERRGPLARTYNNFTVLGNGEYGKVYRCQRKDNGKIVALKESLKDLSDKTLAAVKQEAEITKLLSNCPHGSEDEGCRFNHTMGAFLSVDRHGAAHTYIEMDYIDGVAAKDLLAERGTKASDHAFHIPTVAEKVRPHFIRLIKDFLPLLKTLQNFHGHSVVLQDIHLGNIMWDAANDRFLFIDFGLARLPGGNEFPD